MEAAFGTSFADVRVHVGPEAASIGALAFTHGNSLYFAPGQYNPQTRHGQRLLGHELTHVVQQRAGRVRSPLVTGVAVVQDPALEAEADRMGLHAAAVLPIQAKPAGGGQIGTISQTAGPGPNSVAANGAIQPVGSLSHHSVQRKTGLLLPGKQSAFGRTEVKADQIGGLAANRHRTVPSDRFAGPAVSPVQAKPAPHTPGKAIVPIAATPHGIMRAVGRAECPALRLATKEGSRNPIQMKKIIRHGTMVDVADNYVLQPGEQEVLAGGMELRRRRTEANAGVEDDAARTGYHPPGRPYMATRDDHHAHGPTAWGSTLFMVATGTVDPFALRNSYEETRAHLERARIEQHQGFPADAALSLTQAGVSAAQGVTATPIGHIITHPIMHATLSQISNSIPNPYGDVGWYVGHEIKDQLQKRKTKRHID
jgi:hypothetical protein